jgi:hypothetical protein
MLNRTLRTFFVARAWILSFSCLAIIVVIAETSKPFQTCIKEGNYYSATENCDNSVSSVKIVFEVYPSCFGEFTHDNAEAIIATFTIILALSTIFLWVATRDLVKDAEATAVRQLRAYATANGGEFEVKDGKFHSSVIIENVGQTPAYKLRVASLSNIIEHPVPKTFDFTVPVGKNPSTVTLGPRAPIRHPSAIDKVLTQEEFDRATKAAAGFRVYTYGTVIYEDIFGKRQHTNFCFYVEWNESETVAFGIQGDHHNDAS